MTLAVAVLAVLLPLGAQNAEGVPREPISDELQPFAALDGVRLTIRGFAGGAIWNVVGDTGGDPETVITGFTRKEQDAIDERLWSRSKSALADYGVPLLEPSFANGRTPELLINVSWMYQPSPDRFAVQVEASLQEQASLFREPSRTVWVPTWMVTGRAFATRETFRTVVEGFVRNYVAEFGEHYRRSRPWAKPPSR